MIILTAAPKTKDPLTAIEAAKTTAAVAALPVFAAVYLEPLTLLLLWSSLTSKELAILCSSSLFFLFVSFFFFFFFWENKQRLRKRTKKTANEHRDFLLGK